MAISFISQIPANKFLPSSNPINITVNSNNSGKCNFRYVCDIYVNSLMIFRLKLFPEPNTGWAFFQLSDIIDDYLSEYLPATYTAAISVGTGLGAAPDCSVVSVFCRFGEEYDNSANCDGPIDLYANLATGNTFFSFYGSFDYADWNDYNSVDFPNWVTNHTSGATINFLTDRPRGSAECSYEDTYVLDWLCNVAPIAGSTQIKIRLDNGNIYSIASPTISNSVKRLRATVGPFNINRHFNTALINASVKYYDVWIETSGFQVTEKFRIKITKPKVFRSRFGFIGLKGSPEFITFFHRNREALNIDRKNYKRYLTSRKGNSWGYAVGDRQTQTWASTVKNLHTVSTFVSEDQSKWLNQLWISNNIWIETKPLSTGFRVFREDTSPTSRMLIWLNDASKFKAGDSIFLISDNKPEFSDYNGEFTIVSVNENIIDIGFTYNFYNLTDDACGWLVKNELGVRIPIVAEDGSVEIKQKGEGLIEYTFTYSDSVDKITLRS